MFIYVLYCILIYIYTYIIYIYIHVRTKSKTTIRLLTSAHVDLPRESPVLAPVQIVQQLLLVRRICLLHRRSQLSRKKWAHGRRRCGIKYLQMAAFPYRFGHNHESPEWVEPRDYNRNSDAANFCNPRIFNRVGCESSLLKRAYHFWERLLLQKNHDMAGLFDFDHQIPIVVFGEIAVTAAILLRLSKTLYTYVSIYMCTYMYMHIHVYIYIIYVYKQTY